MTSVTKYQAINGLKEGGETMKRLLDKLKAALKLVLPKRQTMISYRIDSRLKPDITEKQVTEYVKNAAKSSLQLVSRQK